MTAKRLSKGLRNARDWVYRSIWRGSVLGYVGIESRALTSPREPWHVDLDRPGIDAIQKLGQRHFPRAVRVPAYLLRRPDGRVITLGPADDFHPECRVLWVEYSNGVFRWRTMSLVEVRRAELEDDVTDPFRVLPGEGIGDAAKLWGLARRHAREQS